MEFKNKTVLVTGAGGGSGKAIAEAFLKAGAVVIAADLKIPQWHEATDMFHPVSLDVSEEVAVDKVVSEYCEKYGCIDILVNNAGIAIGSPLIDFTLDIWQKNFKVNACLLYTSDAADEL